MFGWIRKLTKRTAVEESTDTSSLLAPDNSAVEAAAQQAPLPRTDSIAPQTPESAQNMVDVYTPEPMPEPPTFELPEPQFVEPFEGSNTLEEDVFVEDEHVFTPSNATERTSAFAAPVATITDVAAPITDVSAPIDTEPVAATQETTVQDEATLEAFHEVSNEETGSVGEAGLEPTVLNAQNAFSTEATEVTKTNEVADAAAVLETETVIEAAITAETAAPETAAAPKASTELEPSPLEAEFDGLLAAPSPRPAMPLSAHPNFAGLGLAQWEPIAPRLLEPEAALTPEAQEELLKLFDDLFGPCGRYRLEWRTERRAGDDAMFAEIMTADLVRRVQNTIADVAELERPEPPKAIQAAFLDREDDEDADEAFRQAS